ncbi:hypothetical protein BOO71_0007486 [Deinococcus marmoris]|uniref:Uncharacterized protein n=1 Tax=Deinococcus marmoris TaxID=249408 RepID=A0A1U7NY77_9DEIO|nr:hypothetical protein BOO71_0007486 [Deinococcus marmoris]
MEKSCGLGHRNGQPLGCGCLGYARLGCEGWTGEPSEGERVGRKV